jgi:pre-mRNA-splicing factor CWC26
MSMKAYLAEKYMSGPKADAILAQAGSGKKKKRKATTGAAGTAPSFIVDEDVSGFARIHVEDDDESAAPVVASDRGFKKRRTAPDGAGWSTVREPTPPPAADEQPQLVDDDVASASAPAPAFAGGLLSKAQVARALPGAAASSSKSMTKDEIAAAQETVYRDASGRKIDMTAERAAAAEKKRARELKEAEKMEWGKGLVQRDAAEEARKQLERMKTTAFARTVDDAALNAEQKDVERWNDPAAQFLSVGHPPSVRHSSLAD